MWYITSSLVPGRGGRRAIYCTAAPPGRHPRSLRMSRDGQQALSARGLCGPLVLLALLSSSRPSPPPWPPRHFFLHPPRPAFSCRAVRPPRAGRDEGGSRTLRRSAGGCTKRLGAAGTRGARGAMWKTASASPPSGGRPRLVAEAHPQRTLHKDRKGGGLFLFTNLTVERCPFLFIYSRQQTETLPARMHESSRTSSRPPRPLPWSYACSFASLRNSSTLIPPRGSSRTPGEAAALPSPPAPAPRRESIQRTT